MMRIVLDMGPDLNDERGILESWIVLKAINIAQRRTMLKSVKQAAKEHMARLLTPTLSESPSVSETVKPVFVRGPRNPA
jgi:hypothetical protein